MLDNIELMKIEDEKEREIAVKQFGQVEIWTNQYNELEAKLKQLKQVLDTEKEKIYGIFETHDIKSVSFNSLTLTRVEPAQRVIIDSARIKKEKPEIFEEYSKVSNVKGYLKITKAKEVE